VDLLNDVLRVPFQFGVHGHSSAYFRVLLLSRSVSHSSGRENRQKVPSLPVTLPIRAESTNPSQSNWRRAGVHSMQCSTAFALASRCDHPRRSAIIDLFLHPIVSTSSGQDFTSTGAVTAIDVATGNGNDHVTYELESSLTTPNQELVFVGSGARNGRGTVQFTFNIVGAIEDGSNLVALAVPGAKNPTMLTVNDSGEIDGDFSAGTSLFGETKIKPGPEKFSERQGHPHRQRLREHQGKGHRRGMKLPARIIIASRTAVSLPHAPSPCRTLRPCHTPARSQRPCPRGKRSSGPGCRGTYPPRRRS
jgi:hypothetical protein